MTYRQASSSGYELPSMGASSIRDGRWRSPPPQRIAKLQCPAWHRLPLSKRACRQSAYWLEVLREYPERGTPIPDAESAPPKTMPCPLALQVGPCTGKCLMLRRTEVGHHHPGAPRAAM
ncbi:hypothetical protein HYC85_027747 [Camellia sinensis]|uniref:Uncharacterized protein n=1 Tax=Camellia sinensis TaxID=4442 RepID=A0A7J7FX65_CAMSI|nr:hypothetical protein HYC85_027747 [Camellia sinensis]